MLAAEGTSPPLSLVPRIKIWLEAEGEYALGWGISEILLEIDRTGSIKQTAKNLGKSYRYVWNRIQEAEAAIGRPLVASRVGGAGNQRSHLTPQTKELAEAFLELRAAAIRFCHDEFARRFPISVSDTPDERPGIG